MTSFLFALLVSLNPSTDNVPPLPPATEPAHVQAVDGTDAITDMVTTASPEDAAIRTMGPFATYLKAADVADYLEIEYGFDTLVTRSSSGYYYVYYW